MLLLRTGPRVIGLVPHLLVGFLDEVAGPDTRRAILAEAGFPAETTRFRLDADVPDPATRRMVEVTCARLGATEVQVFALFAPYFLARARAAFPGFFQNVEGARAFLLRQPAIHNSLSAGLRDPQRRVVADKFRVEATPRGVRMHYNSPNRMAALYTALAHELARSYGEVAEITFEAGGPEDAACTVHVELSRLVPAAQSDATRVAV